MAFATAVAVPSRRCLPQAQPNYAEVREAQQAVTMSGPLADFMSSQIGSKQESSKVETLAADCVQTSRHRIMWEDSPVGTSNPILHQTFRVAGHRELAV